ncbi:MAG TPA: SAF domain-containing protein [Pyrinomonadaceae bacterium]|jgi:hypothetical protein|nr:SAF domain-containing protein [Pyrinomonadaceae bacterium]
MKLLRRRKWKQFTADEAKVLRDLGITDFDALWERVGKDYDSGLDNVLRGAGPFRPLSAARVREILADLGERDVALPRGPGLVGRVKYGADACWRWRGRSWGWCKAQYVPTAAILLLLLAPAVLLARAFFWLDRPVVVTARGMAAGRALVPADLLAPNLTTRGDAYTNSFASAAAVEGCRLAKDVSRGEVLRHEHLLRLQAVATRDIPLGSTISGEDVALGWSPYKPDAVLDLRPVTDHKSRRAIRSGEVILRDDVGQFVFKMYRAGLLPLRDAAASVGRRAPTF